MKRLRINFTELADAFEHGGQEFAYYLDGETGEVLMVGEQARRLLDQIYEKVSAGERDQIDLAAALTRRGVVDWMEDDVRTAHRIDREYGSRYIQVPESDSFEGYADMKAFIESLSDQPFADRLWTAIQGKGAFRRFKDTLAAQPALEQRWYTFKDAAVRERIAGWLSAHDIEAAEPA